MHRAVAGTVRRVGAPGLAALALWAGVSLAGEPASRPAAWARGLPKWTDGRLKDAAPELGKLVQLTWEERRLRLDRDVWLEREDSNSPAEQEAPGKVNKALPDAGTGAQPAEGVFSRLRARVGFTRASSGGGGSERQASFSGRGLSGEMRISGGEFYLRLREEAGAGRSLEFGEDDSGALRLVFMDGEGDWQLVLTQTRSGRFSVIDVQDGQAFVQSAESFLAFYGSHREYVEARLFPLLEMVGVGVGVHPDRAPVRQHVLDLLRNPITDQDRRRVEQLVEQLNSDSAAERDQATQTLDENFLRWQEFIDAAAARADLPPEPAARLKSIAGGHRTDRKVRQLVASLKLTEDPVYLVRLMSAAGADERQVVARQLEKVTGQKFGADAEAWMKWLQRRPATQPARP